MPSHEDLPEPAEVTQLLKAWERGDKNALDALTPLVYRELRRLAHARMRNEAPGNPLQTTALVHEVYIRLVDVTGITWQNRAHFMAIAAQMMRRIVIDGARAQRTGKRGGAAKHFSIDEALVLSPAQDVDFVALDEALIRLNEFDARKAQVVELRFFGGLTERESAEVLGVSAETVGRDWQLAKAWLRRTMTESSTNGS